MKLRLLRWIWMGEEMNRGLALGVPMSVLRDFRKTAKLTKHPQDLHPHLAVRRWVDMWVGTAP